MAKSLRVGTKVWAEKINGALRKAAFDWTRACIEAGHILLAAKRECAPGDFHDMLENDLEVEPRTAQRCMKVAAHPVLGDTTNLSRLPAAFSALHELSKMPPTDVLRLIEGGIVRPETRIQDVVALLPPAQPKAREAAEQKPVIIDVDHEEITPSADEADTPAAMATCPLSGSAVPAPDISSGLDAADRHEGGDSDGHDAGDPITHLMGPAPKTLPSQHFGEVSVFDAVPGSPSAVAVDMSALRFEDALLGLDRYESEEDDSVYELRGRLPMSDDRFMEIVEWLLEIEDVIMRERKAAAE